jgi:Ca-activated chloride channel family protein
MASGETYYERLGIARGATPEEIRRVYRHAARQFHPDTNVEPGETELFLAVQEAYDVLSDPDKRAAYDATLPPVPPSPPASPTHPIALNVLYSRSALHYSDEPQLLYVLVEMAARKENSKPLSPPLNVCLLIDSSTSMQGLVMDTVKSTAIELVRQMRPNDIFSIVAFSDRADVIVPAGRRVDINQIESGIQMLQPRGGTEIYRGLEAGYAEVNRYRDASHINHILLITDGRTYGDEVECLRIAQQCALANIGISSLGLGDHWNDHFLDRLAALTGGSTQYIRTAKEIRDYLKSKFDVLGSRYVDHVRYEFNPGPKTHIRYAFRLTPDASPIQTVSPLQVGSIPTEGNLSILMEFMIEEVPQGVQQFCLADGRLSMNIPYRNASQFGVHLALSCPASEEGDFEAPPSAIVQAMSRLTLYRMQDRARQDVEGGNIPEATRQLQFIATHLFSQGQVDLAHTVIKEIETIESTRAFSQSGEKRIKYGTRGLMLPANVSEAKR